MEAIVYFGMYFVFNVFVFTMIAESNFRAGKNSLEPQHVIPVCVIAGFIFPVLALFSLIKFTGRGGDE